jgi:hypothetical protein
MNHSTNSTAELDQTDEDFFCEVSDETLEVAAGTHIGSHGDRGTNDPDWGMLLTWKPARTTTATRPGASPMPKP